jgi:hypothetical protein
MSEEFSEQSLLTAQCIVSAARNAGYLVEDEAMQSSPELAELEKPLFIKMFQAFKEHLQNSGRMELTSDEVASMFNFAVGKGAEMAYNFMSSQKQDCNVVGLFDSRISLYVDDRLMNFLKAEPIAAKLGGAYVDFQNENSDIDPVLGLFEALKWTMRITEHVTLKLIQRWNHADQR